MPSLKTFCMRTAEPSLLRAFFARHDVDLNSIDDLDDDADAKAIAAKVSQEFKLRPPSHRSAVDTDLARIEKLASEFGESALDDTTMTDELKNLSSQYARALHIFLYDEAGFRRAEEIVFNDVRRGGKQWNAFCADRDLDLARNEAAVEQLKQGLRDQFGTPNVHLEIFDRVRPQLADGSEDSGHAELVQITIYREARPNTEYAFKDGELGTEVRRPVMEASVTYEPRTGMIECVAPQRDDRSEIAKLLAVNLLGCKPEFQPVPARAYDLSTLSRRIEFVADPVDQIENVMVEMLKLIPLETTGELVTVESRRSSSRDIWEVVDERLGSGALERDYTIAQARFVIRYRSSENNSTRSLPVTITHPDRCNLKERTDVERAVGNKYLPRWGLVVAA